MNPLWAAAVLVVLTARTASPHTWTVGAAGADFPLIAPAIAAAADGDTIVIGPGVYRENLVLHRRVALVGDGSPVLYGLGTGSVIRIMAAGCEIRALTIEGSGSGESNEMDAAIQVASDGNRISGPGYAGQNHWPSNRWRRSSYDRSRAPRCMYCRVE